MRDPARIDRILNAVRSKWVEYPDLRLGQIVVNAIHPSRPCPQIFFAEDDVTERGLMSTTQPAYQPGEVTLELSQYEAIVIFEFLARFSMGGKPLAVEDGAEEQVLHGVSCLLEKQLTDPFSREWPVIIEQARTALRPDVS